MSKRVKALIKPELLLWARESSRLPLEFVASKVRVPSAQLAGWERGDAYPSLAQLRKLANVYKRPLAVFYLSKPPRDFDAMHDFRRVQNAGALSISPLLALEMRKAWQRREVAIELADELGDLPVAFDLSFHPQTSAREASKMIREALGIKLGEQFRWRTHGAALNSWKKAVELLGVLVFEVEKITVKEMRGFSIGGKRFPVIALNSKDSKTARIFTLFHELAHLALNRTGLCDLRDDNAKVEDRDIEIFCNQVAGLSLVPTASLLAQPELAVSHGGRWPDDEIAALSGRYKVSPEMLLRRLLSVDKISPSFYKTKRKEYEELNAKLIEEEKRKAKERRWNLPRYRAAVRNNGAPFTRRVINAFHDDVITLSDVSDFLDVGVKHLPKIENHVFVGPEKREHG